MNTIYLISYSSGKTVDFSAAHATDEESIKQLALEWYWTGWEGERGQVEVNVDMDKRTVTVYDRNGYDSITYDIHTFVRVA